MKERKRKKKKKRKKINPFGEDRPNDHEIVE